MKLLVFKVVVGVILCGVTASVRLAAHDPIGSRVTWTGDIARIFQARCVGCHRVGTAETVPLTTYEEVRPWVSAIRQQVLSRKMPIWHAARGFGDFVDDPSLSPFEIALIAAWANAGGPQGSAADVSNAKAQAPAAAARSSAAPRKGRKVVLSCGTQPLTGRLLAVNPTLAAGGSLTITAATADGQEGIVAWIRDYDPRYPTTYWLRTPVDLSRGSRLVLAASGPCSVTATLAR